MNNRSFERLPSLNAIMWRQYRIKLALQIAENWLKPQVADKLNEEVKSKQPIITSPNPESNSIPEAANSIIQPADINEQSAEIINLDEYRDQRQRLGMSRKLVEGIHATPSQVVEVKIDHDNQYIDDLPKAS